MSASQEHAGDLPRGSSILSNRVKEAARGLLAPLVHLAGRLGGWGRIGQVAPLQPVPDVLDGIQLGCVAGQRHRLQSFRLDEFRGGLMDFPAVPDDEDAAAEVVVQVAEEGGDVLGLEVAVLARAEGDLGNAFALGIGKHVEISGV